MFDINILFVIVPIVGFVVCHFYLYNKRLKKGPIKVLIEGNIGAGKSTFLKKIIPNEENIITISEPVDIWKSDGTLGLSYTDPFRWLLTFQMNATLTRFEKITKALSKTWYKYAFIERSSYADKHCFMEAGKDNGHITDTEMYVYNRLFEQCINKLYDNIYNTDRIYVVYIQTKPQTCLARMKNRNRAEEVGVSLEYLQQIHVNHEFKLIPMLEEKYGRDRVLTVDNDCDITDDQHCKKMRSEIMKFLAQ